MDNKLLNSKSIVTHLSRSEAVPNTSVGAAAIVKCRLPVRGQLKRITEAAAPKRKLPHTAGGRADGGTFSPRLLQTGYYNIDVIVPYSYICHQNVHKTSYVYEYEYE